MRDAEQCLSTMINSNSNNVRASEGNNSGIGSNTKPLPTLNQINHAKINQRQDSNISSDSYSMMSSPSYNSKNNMEAPLLHSASKINKSKNHHQNSTDSDSFIMSSMNKSFQRGSCGAGGAGIYAKRQDSGISSSESQKSSINSKLLDAPLLAHAAKMSSCKFSGKSLFHGKFNNFISSMSKLIDKQSYKPSEDIIRDAEIDSCNTNAAIIKSTSTPASLQTIVRFSNGSNMSHTVSYC